MTNLPLRCIVCKTEEKIDFATLGLYQVMQDIIKEKGWELIKTTGTEGYCCKKCGLDQVSTG